MLRMLRMLRTLRLPGRLAVLLGAALAAAGLAVAGAQLAPVFFEIAAAEHDPSGRVIASIAVPDDVELERGKITALLDGVPFPVSDVTRRDPEPLAVVLAIDVSGSMSGGPLAAARQAALDLVERLNAADRVAVVAFADAPVVFSDFTLDREVTNATLRSLVAGGDTALYGAVDTAAQMLAAAGSQRGVLVLLSDGLDDGGVSTVGREQSVDAIVASGAAAYAFALGVQADVAYLGALAERAGGEFAEVTDEQALAAAFAGLGRRLGADVSVTVAVPPQQIGEHELTLRFRAQEEVVEARSRFEVTNAGLVSPIITTPGAPEDEILVELAALVPLASLTLEATANGEPLPLIASTGRMLIDPWLFEPGALQIDFRVTVRGALAAAATATVEIPALEPQITLQQRTDDGGARQLVVSGRVQGSTTAVLRVLVDGEEIARSEEPRLIVAEPTGATAEVILEDGAGGLLKSVPLTLAAPAVAPIPAPAATAAEEGGGSAVLLIAAGAAVVLALLGLVLLRRRRGRRPAPLAAQAPRVLGQRDAERESAGADRGTIVLRRPDGSEVTLAMGMRPVTIGRWEQCDIVLDDEAIRPVHVRVSALGGGEFRVHGMAAPSLRPFATNIAQPDEWMLIHAGEEVKLGDYIIRFQSSEASAPEGAETPAGLELPDEPASEHGVSAPAPPEPSGPEQPQSGAPESPESPQAPQPPDQPERPEYPLSP